MKVSQSLLDEALDGWQFARAGVIDEVENLSEADLKFRPHAESRSAAELIAHIVDSGLMMSGELARADGSFRRKSFPQFMKEYGARIGAAAKKAELIRTLKRTHKEGEQNIRTAGELRMLQTIVQFNRRTGVEAVVVQPWHLARGISPRPGRALRAPRRPRAGADPAHSRTLGTQGARRERHGGQRHIDPLRRRTHGCACAHG